tara:strand:+ start:1130 stop:1756 length:627 start_codon:yes stop_codon:yes gene_type:complete
MSEVVVSKVTNISGDYFIDASQPGSIIQVQAYDYNSVYHNTNIANKECAMPGVLGDGSAKIVVEAGNRILVECCIHNGQQDTWRGNFHRLYWNGGKNDAPAGEYVTSNLNNNTAYGVENYLRTQNSLLWGGGASHSYIESQNGGASTADWTILTPPVDNAGTVNFFLSVVGHSNGNHIHLNNNSSTGSTNTNQNQLSSSIILKEVYFP